MVPKLVKVVASVLIVGGGLSYLLVSSAKDGLEYYKQVDEVAADPERWTGPNLKMGGHVRAGSIFNKPGTLEYVFTVEKDDAAIDVQYTGTVPDTFKEGSEVVVAGRLTPEGRFEAEEVVAKCPSKYEAEEERGELHPEDIPMAANPL